MMGGKRKFVVFNIFFSWLCSVCDPRIFIVHDKNRTPVLRDTGSG